MQAVPNISRMSVASVTVFQRTPCWSPPRFDYQYPEMIKKMFFWLPITNIIHRYFIIIIIITDNIINIIHRYFIFCINEMRYWMIFATDGIISKVCLKPEIKYFCELMTTTTSSPDHVSSDSQTGQKTHQHGCQGSEHS